MTYKLPDLPYSYDSLEPYIDNKTMMIHHRGHHKAYLEKLNNALEKVDYQSRPILALLSKVHKKILDEKKIGSNDNHEINQYEGFYDKTLIDIINNGGGYYNHMLYFQCMSPNSKENDISSNLRERISSDFGSIENFKDQFESAGMTLFGSGWVWLVYKEGKLSIITSKNQDIPVFYGYFPIICCDVWEHAYYLRYKNQRKTYLQNWWSVVDWENASRFYNMAENGKVVEFGQNGEIDL
ncbi:Superoxide dismutase [Mn/Fe] 2 [Dictyocoela muelleri]|nr:Superoxide dismutase [Mn/Fe] 2 [Dictyocoela muelleri]